MKEYRQYLDNSQKELVVKILKTFKYNLEDDEFMDGEAFHSLLVSMIEHLDKFDYILLIEDKHE